MNENILKNLAWNAGNYMKFETERPQTWCTGCGNFGIQNALKRALVLEGFDQKNVLFCFDVGCSGNGADKIEGYSLHGLHGRVISLAAGAALANENIKVISFGGDGATFSEGPGHLIHAVRSNYPMIFVHHNNENFGLTTGQASSLTKKGAKMNASPDGVFLDPINTMDFVLGLKPSFVARGFSGDIDYLTELFRKALRHDGFAYLEVLQSCPTYNRDTPEHWYADRVKHIEDAKNYDSSDIWQARKLVEDLNDEIYTGVIFEDKSKMNFLRAIPNRKNTKTVLKDEVKRYGISEFL